ncbi:hypothetical protein N9A12_03010 [Gammaproteobacteria bacterium]|nr:hypothetical protein [Gammaproteobacteria bacterium]
MQKGIKIDIPSIPTWIRFNFISMTTLEPKLNINNIKVYKSIPIRMIEMPMLETNENS